MANAELNEVKIGAAKENGATEKVGNIIFSLSVNKCFYRLELLQLLP